MARLELPDDQWAELDDPVKVPHKKRKLVRLAMYDLVNAKNAAERTPLGTKPVPDLVDGEGLSYFNDVIILALVREWSFPHPLTLDGLGDLPGDAYDALQLACAPLSNALFPDFSPGPDPKAPQTSTSSPGSPTSLPAAASTPTTTTSEITS